MKPYQAGDKAHTAVAPGLLELKEYKKATHITYAYSINGKEKAFDDGEPNHTAGLPILNIIHLKKMNNVLIVVIRYFGGVKLGAGPLTRAYAKSASEIVKKLDE